MEKKEVKILLDRLQKAADLALETVSGAVTGKPITVPPHVKDHRLTICRSCDRFFPLTSQCRECGCMMNYKTQLTAAECPLKKWNKYESPKES
jgi:hypothetical protein